MPCETPARTGETQRGLTTSVPVTHEDGECGRRASKGTLRRRDMDRDGLMFTRVEQPR